MQDGYRLLPSLCGGCYGWEQPFSYASRAYLDVFLDAPGEQVRNFENSVFLPPVEDRFVEAGGHRPRPSSRYRRGMRFSDFG